MALDFPSSPVNGQVYDNFYYDAAKDTWKSLSSGASPNYLVNPTITDAVITATAPTLSTVPLTVKAATSQTANLQEWDNNTGTALSWVTSNGSLSAPSVSSTQGPDGIAVRAGSVDHAYISYYPRTSTPNTRGAYVGYGSTGSTVFTIANEISGGNMSLNANHVLTPNRVAFEVGNSANSTTAGNDIIWNVAYRNQGSAYNTANGRFTAPVAGLYHFYAWGLWPNANSGDFRVSMFKNGAGLFGARTIDTKPANSWFTWFVQQVTYLNANDYVTIRVEQLSGGMYTAASHNGFVGYLVG